MCVIFLFKDDKRTTELPFYQLKTLPAIQNFQFILKNHLKEIKRRWASFLMLEQQHQFFANAEPVNNIQFVEKKPFQNIWLLLICETLKNEKFFTIQGNTRLLAHKIYFANGIFVIGLEIFGKLKLSLSIKSKERDRVNSVCTDSICCQTMHTNFHYFILS